MSKIYDFPLSFNLVRRYTLFSFKRYYGDFIVVGKENIPPNGPVIFAPNHINALMDALAVHSVASNNLPLIFLAKADIFQNKTAAKFLRFLKIMPAFRMRDGIENLGRNTEIFDQCVEILDNNKALGIMPEGNQELERKLRPLVKGIFRIAFSAQKKYGSQPGVKIIPIGIDYGDIIKSNKHIIINIGEPIEVSDYMNVFEENPVNATNEIRKKLRFELENLSLNLASDTYYDCFERIVEIANKSQLNDLKLNDDTFNRFVARQKIAEKLIEIEKNKSDKIKTLDNQSSDYFAILKHLKLKTELFDNNSIPIIFEVLKAVFLVVMFPFFIVGLILNFLPFFSPVFIRKYILKAKDVGFYSTLQFGLGIITFPLFYILQVVLFSCVFNLTGLDFLLFFLVQFPLGMLAIKWNSMTQKYIANLRYKILKQKKSPELFHAQSLREQIIRTIF